MVARYYPDDGDLNIARGIVKGTSHNHKFGAVKSLSTSTTGTIWDVNDTVYPWSAFDTANTAIIPAVDTNDNGKVVTVQGLDQDYEFVEETFTVSSSANTSGSIEFKRINRAFVSTGADNEDDIDVEMNGSVVARISAGLGQTLMGVYTVPANTDAFITHFNASADTADASLFLRRRFDGESAFRIGHVGELSGGTYDYTFKVPLAFPAKTDIDIRATARTNNARITTAFCLILVKEGLG